jgi:hypothetical protein
MRLALGVLVLVASGCSGSGPLKVAPADAAPDLGVLDARAGIGLAPVEGSTDDAGCWHPNYPLPAPVTCRGDKLACDPGWDNCLSTPASSTLARLAQECGFACGGFVVGFVGGCASEIRRTTDSPNMSGSAVEACLFKAILGQRWTCMPEDGWVRVFVTSCTLV